MAVRSRDTTLGERLITRWHLGVGAGIAAVVPMVGANMLLVGTDVPSLFGLLPFAILWGLVYAGLTTIDRLHEIAADPQTGPWVGIGYSALVWMGPQLGEPIGQGTFTLNGTVQVVLFGLMLGVVYVLSPE